MRRIQLIELWERLLYSSCDYLHLTDGRNNSWWLLPRKFLKRQCQEVMNLPLSIHLTPIKMVSLNKDQRDGRITCWCTSSILYSVRCFWQDEGPFVGSNSNKVAVNGSLTTSQTKQLSNPTSTASDIWPSLISFTYFASLPSQFSLSLSLSACFSWTAQIAVVIQNKGEISVIYQIAKTDLIKCVAFFRVKCSTVFYTHAVHDQV